MVSLSSEAWALNSCAQCTKLAIKMNTKFTILFVAPFYNRSGYGSGARALVNLWLTGGYRIKIIPVDQVEEGVDDCDIALLRSLEKTEISGQVVAIFYHVPNQAWLNLQLPRGALRVMFTTFDGVLQGQRPPANWIDICNQMDLVFLNQSEIDGWYKAGLKKSICRRLEVPHNWVNNSILPKIKYKKTAQNFKFLTIAMYQPRRRWDTLFQAFLEEFSDDESVELHVKVNFPSWHPTPGQPRRDFYEMLTEIRGKVFSKASIIVDEDLGTRLDICELIDSCNCLVSTDTAITAPLGEGLIRGKHVVAPNSLVDYLPSKSTIAIAEDIKLSKPIDEEILKYQPYHRSASMPLLKTEDVRAGLREAYLNTKIQSQEPWEDWRNFLDDLENDYKKWERYFSVEVSEALEKKLSDKRIQVYWEGSQFVYHSLAHVNRQLCRHLSESDQINLSLIPYEKDQFDPKEDMPEMAALLECVKLPLDAPRVHVRHQWPPNFKAPSEGAWVMIQPWEFGGLPLQWVAPMRDNVDEIWVPSSWVKECYIKSGVPAEKVQVISNGVNCEIFRPDGPRYKLKTRKKFRFLFLGGTIHRKGIDIALSAYLQSFSSEDDVCLVIKGQSGQVYSGSQLTDTLNNLHEKNKKAPEIEYINDALTEAEISALYRSCDVLLAPYRGEGFGLPIAEAMASGLALIVTAEGASKDFVRKEFAYCIPSSKKITHLDEFQESAPGYWLEEPDLSSVSDAMVSAYNAPDIVKSMGMQARIYAINHLGWDKAVSKILDRLAVLSNKLPIRKILKKTAFIFTADGSKAQLTEILSSYIFEFKPDEPVVLALIFNSILEREKVIRTISEVIGETGANDFPEVMIIESVQEMLDLTKNYHLQWVETEMGSVLGLDGSIGHRLGRSRLLFQAARQQQR